MSGWVLIGVWVVGMLLLGRLLPKPVDPAPSSMVTIGRYYLLDTEGEKQVEVTTRRCSISGLILTERKELT